MQYKRILIIQTAFIGDAILASALAEKLHTAFPQAEISMLVRKGNESLYLQHPFLRETLCWNKQQEKWKNLFRLLKYIRTQQYDLLVNCHRHLSSGLLAGFSKARYICGYKENPLSFLFNYTVKHIIGDGRHEVERYGELTQEVCEGPMARPRLYPSTAHVQAIEKYTTTAYVCMAPSSVWFTKQLPLQKWIDLCKLFPENISIYLLGAAGDVHLCETISKACPTRNIKILAGELSLLESCALMQRASMNYVNDSAPLHLASAVNAPVTAFFCSTVPQFGFSPLSDRQQVIETKKTLNCRPCGLHGFSSCPEKHFDCGHSILVEDVVKGFMENESAGLKP